MARFPLDRLRLAVRRGVAATSGWRRRGAEAVRACQARYRQLGARQARYRQLGAGQARYRQLGAQTRDWLARHHCWPEGLGRRRVMLLAVVAAALVVAVSLSLLPRILTETSASANPRAGAVVGDCAGRPTQTTRELRGMWLTTVGNADWPSRQGLDAEAVRAEYRDWLDLAQRLDHNAIFVHVRPSGDAFWPSKYAPWSEWLTGRRDGKGPGWDPLKFLVAETHRRGLEFHAWFNPYRASAAGGADFEQLAPNHPLRQHRDWAVTYPADDPKGKIYYNPGIPAARRFVEDSILDAVDRYDIDAVHFDDFFYPYPVAGEDFPDDATFAQHGGGFASKADWRRDNVNRFVQETGQRIKQRKPWVKFGISPFGIWRNAGTDPLGSATRGLQSFDAIYADTRLWVQRQWLDYIVPQLYWNIGFEIADYATLVSWWSKVVSGTRVQLYIGQADYRVGTNEVWSDPSELERQIALNHRYAVGGSVHFTARDLRRDKLGAVKRYHAAHNAEPALVPVMTQLPAGRLAVPDVASARRTSAGEVTVSWRRGKGLAATRFAVYRLEDRPPGASASGQPGVPASERPTAATSGSAEAARLVAVVAGTGGARQSWTDRAAVRGRSYSYCVAALDRSWNASGPGEPARIRLPA